MNFWRRYFIGYYLIQVNYDSDVTKDGVIEALETYMGLSIY